MHKKIKQVIKCIGDEFTDFNISTYKQMERKKYDLRARKNTLKSRQKSTKVNIFIEFNNLIILHT